jgi:hypothetical protein
MHISLSDYFRIFSSYTNPVAIIFSAVLWTIGSFLLFVLLVILFRKFILVERRNKFLKYLSWSYFFLIPVLSIYFGFKFGLLNGTRHDLKEHAHTYTKELDAVMKESLGTTADEFFVEMVNEKNTSGLTTRQVMDRFAEKLAVQFTESLATTANEKEGFSETVAGLFLYIVKSKGGRISLKYAVREALDKELGVDETSGQDLMQVKFRELLEKGIFTSILRTEIDRFFLRMQKGTLILFGILLFFPIAEIVVAHILLKRKKRAENPFLEASA